MAEKLEVDNTGHYYRVGNWSFDEEDKNIAYIDEAIAAWTAWREYVQKEHDAFIDIH